MRVYFYNYDDIWILYSDQPFDERIKGDNLYKYHKRSIKYHEDRDTVEWFLGKIKQDTQVEWEI